MTYQECLDYLFSQLPIYQREGKAAYKADLNNTIELLKRLNNPERGFKSIHIAGTNGKGSVSHMLSSILQEAGYKVGLYTSPHLKDFRERIKINGKEISEEEVLNFVDNNKALVEDIHPSFFEWTVALCFNYFREEEVDVAVIETGMGGRLDSTNVLMPELSIITNIGMDHVQFLGNSLGEIAGEKAGIIKENTPVVVGEYLSETRRVFEEKAKEMCAPLLFAQDHEREVRVCDLQGPYQKKNQNTVLNALPILVEKGYEIHDSNISRGLENVIGNTGLHGRWEWIGKEPGILIDMAHNKDGIEMVLNEIGKLQYHQLRFVWGMVNDKDIDGIMRILPKDALYYFCKPNIPRGLEVNILQEKANSMRLKGSIFNSVKEALNQAVKDSDREDLIFVGGSTFVVAEVVI